MTPQEIFQIAKEEIHKIYPKVKGIYVFGSFASRTETKDSDLDIAILLDKPAESTVLWNLAQNIAYRIHREVDLIDLFTASTVLRFQIITTAKRIEESDFKACDLFEDLSFSMYIRFNEERKGILEDIKKTGRILNG
jgi:predicted nucleotidyltransferase